MAGKVNVSWATRIALEELERQGLIEDAKILTRDFGKVVHITEADRATVERWLSENGIPIRSSHNTK